MRRALQGILLSLALVASARAHAQIVANEAAFGGKGHFVVSAERLFGYLHVTNTQDSSSMSGQTNKSTTTSNAYSFLGSSLNTIGGAFTFPRVGADVFVTPELSVGAAATYFRNSSNSDLDLGQPPDNVFTFTNSGYLLAPRVGYAVRVGLKAWVWLRAGITYASLSSSNGSGLAVGPQTQTSNSSFSLTAITIEAPIAVGLGSHAVLLIGPTVDIGITGTEKFVQSSGDLQNLTSSSTAKESNFGLQAGVALTF
jgi:hypothetical protein